MTIFKTKVSLVVITTTIILKLTAVKTHQEQYITSSVGSMFYQMKGVYFKADDSESTFAGSLEYCALICQRSYWCKSATYRPLYTQCLLNVQYLQQESTLKVSVGNIRYDKASVYIYIPARFSWRMVFRASTKMKYSLYDAWTFSNSPYNEESPVDSTSMGCQTNTNTLLCDNYFRSNYFNKWGGFSSARFVFYLKGTIKTSITFDANGVMSWDDLFKIQRIKNTSIAELRGYSGYHELESIEGDSGCGRRFALTKYNNGVCKGITGWFFITDGLEAGAKGCCNFDDISLTPMFHYSKTGLAVNYRGDNSGSLGIADVFCVFIQ